MLAELVDEVHGLYSVAFLGVVGVVGAIVTAVLLLVDAVGIDLEEVDAGVAYVVEDVVENVFLD